MTHFAPDLISPRPVAYLCGGINGLSDAEAMDWRTQVRAALEPTYEVLDPMRRDYRGREADSVDEIVLADYRDLSVSDLVVVNAVRPSVGTDMEIRDSFYDGRATVVAVCPLSTPSPWLQFHTDRLVSTFDEALALIAGAGEDPHTLRTDLSLSRRREIWEVKGLEAAEVIEVVARRGTEHLSTIRLTGPHLEGRARTLFAHDLIEARHRQRDRIARSDALLTAAEAALNGPFDLLQDAMLAAFPMRVTRTERPVAADAMLNGAEDDDEPATT